MIRNIFGAMLALFLAGCAATGPIFTSAPSADGKALVYVYRVQDAWAYRGVPTHIVVDGKDVVDLRSNGYSYFYLSPGHHEVTQKWPSYSDPFSRPENVALDTGPGETRYIRFSVWTTNDMGRSGVGADWSFKEVPVFEAINELPKLKFEVQNPKTGFSF